jgi:hypothetical protein
MTSGWLMLGLGTLICLGLFANGMRFARLGQPLPADNPGEIKRRMIGMIFMTLAPLFWLLFAAVCFGAFGAVRNIQTIELG